MREIEDIEPTELYDIEECVGRGNFGDVYKAYELYTFESGSLCLVSRWICKFSY